MKTLKFILVALSILLSSACIIQPPTPRAISFGHLQSNDTSNKVDSIPSLIELPIIFPEPIYTPDEDRYTVIVNEVPVKDLLFALARDSQKNIDVHPDINGLITLNAVDQNMTQIFSRVSLQTPIRFMNDNNSIQVLPDTPYVKSYTVDYVNVTRASSANLSASTLVSSSELIDINSNTSENTITNVTKNDFWQTLNDNIQAILSMSNSSTNESSKTPQIIMHQESGVIMVRATQKQHRIIGNYIQSVSTRATRQVLIEATLVEVALNDRYQAGIDWQAFSESGGLTGAGLSIGTDLVGAFETASSNGIMGLILNYADASIDSGNRNFAATVKLLNEFGEAKVISSPKIMALNNQPAVLKVVDNEVYFTLDTDTSQNDNTTVVTVESEVRTVSVGLILNVTPQIGDNGKVILNIRPTITRVREFVNDPAIPIILAQSGLENSNIINPVPVIQVRETESVLQIQNKQLAVLGGLIQDKYIRDIEEVPGASDLPLIGNSFQFKDQGHVKTELVVFLKPTITNTNTNSTSINALKNYLPNNLSTYGKLPVNYFKDTQYE